MIYHRAVADIAPTARRWTCTRRCETCLADSGTVLVGDHVIGVKISSVWVRLLCGSCAYAHTHKIHANIVYVLIQNTKILKIEHCMHILPMYVNIYVCILYICMHIQLYNACIYNVCTLKPYNPKVITQN